MTDYIPKFADSPALREFRLKLAQELARLHSEIDRLSAERDEARRQVCAMLCAEHPTKLFPPNRYSTPEACAKFYGWDCFEKEA